MSSTTDLPFKTIAIAGIGLIGGSIALAVRERWPSIRIIGIDRPSVLAHVYGSGAIDSSAASIGELRQVDLLVLAAPVRQNAELLHEAARAVPGAVVTDVGGTKREIVEAARTLGATVTFVGGHPIGGAEQGGFGFARPDLFRGRPWIFTPTAETPTEPLQKLFTFAAELGARPTTLDAAEHDRLMAFLSHLPQLTASVLMETVGAAVGGEGLRLAGRGLVDTTRLASSPAGVWRDICASNSGAIGEALDRLIARLTELRCDLDGGSAVNAVFERAARWRAELMKGRE